mgnify:CR=1 FL=1
MRKKLSCVYEIKNIVNGRRYIGSTTNFESRICKHKWMLKNNVHKNKWLQQDYNLYGIDCFEFNAIKPCKPSQLLVQEQCYLDRYYWSGSYNVRPAITSKYMDNYLLLTEDDDVVGEPLVDACDWEEYIEFDPDLQF